MRRYKFDLGKLRAKLPEPEPEEDELTADARRIHDFLTVRAREDGDELDWTVQDVRDYLVSLQAEQGGEESG